jgi:iron-sulfur cluster assembly protein
METKTASTECPVALSPGALAEIRRLLVLGEASEGQILRIGVKGGGCSGLSYVLGFDEPQATDQLYTVEDVRIGIDPSHALYLAGMVIDYSDGLDNRGFSFNNPNASETCGCGSSFSA